MLILDREEHIRLILLALQGLRLTILGVQHAELALRVCCVLPVSLLLSDDQLLDSNGYLHREMQADSELRRIPIVVAASRVGRDARQPPPGVMAVLVSPILGEELERAVQETLVQHGNWRTPRGFQREPYDALCTPDQDVLAVGQHTVRVMRPRR